MQRGEGIVGDLGPGVRGRGEEGGLAGVRQADEAGVGDQLQAQPERALDALLARVGAARARLVEDLKCRLPQPPLPPWASSDALARLGQVGDQRLLVLVEDLGADGHLQDDVVAVGAGASGCPCRRWPFLAKKCCW